MKSKLLLIISGLFFGMNCSAQIKFQKSIYGNNILHAYAIKQTSDTGYCIAGTSFLSSNFKENACLIKLNKTGDTLWTKGYSEATAMKALDVTETPDHGYLVAGQMQDISNYELLFLKTNDNGDTMWMRSYGGDSYDYAAAAIVTFDSNYVFSGSLATPGTGYFNAFILKMDIAGDTLWTRVFVNPDTHTGADIKQMPDSGFVMSGFSGGVQAGFYIIRTDANGDTLWTHNYTPVVGSLEFGSLGLTADGGFIVATTAITYIPSSYSILVTRLTATGDTLWNRNFSTGEFSKAYSISETADGNFMLSGVRQIDQDSGYSLLMKIDGNGNNIWTHLYETIDYSSVFRGQITNDYGYIAVGTAVDTMYSTKIMLDKTDSAGAGSCYDQPASFQTSYWPLTIANAGVSVTQGIARKAISPGLLNGVTGKSTDCMFTAVGDIELNKVILISPNPASAFITLPSTLPGKSITHISNLLGQSVMTITINENKNNSEVDVSSLVPGIYFLRAENDRGMWTGKFLKE